MPSARNSAIHSIAGDAFFAGGCYWFANCSRSDAPGALTSAGDYVAAEVPGGGALAPRPTQGLAPRPAAGAGWRHSSSSSTTTTGPALPRLILVTATYPHAAQGPKLAACAAALHGERRVLWIVVEDAPNRSTAAAAVLETSGLAYVHLAAGPSHAKGHVQRELAYDLIRRRRLRGGGSNVAPAL